MLCWWRCSSHYFRKMLELCLASFPLCNDDDGKSQRTADRVGQMGHWISTLQNPTASTKGSQILFLHSARTSTSLTILYVPLRCGHICGTCHKSICRRQNVSASAGIAVPGHEQLLLPVHHRGGPCVIASQHCARDTMRGNHERIFHWPILANLAHTASRGDICAVMEVHGGWGGV